MPGLAGQILDCRGVKIVTGGSLLGALVVVLAVLAFPCIVIGLLASPLCGAALTFFAAAKKVSKESGLTPPILKRGPWLGGCSGSVEIGSAHLLA